MQSGTHSPRTQRSLTSDVCVVEVELAPQDFHARHDAVSRTYLYQISTRRTAFLKKYVWWVKEDLDIAAMSRATAMLIGRHDFAAFRALDPARPDASTVVVVQAASIETEGHLILFRISASHYLWRMVRRIVGVLVKVGLGELKPEDLLRALSGKASPQLDIAAWTAPASGLFLESVEYAPPKRARKPAPAKKRINPGSAPNLRRLARPRLRFFAPRLQGHGREKNGFSFKADAFSSQLFRQGIPAPRTDVVFFALNLSSRALSR